MSRSGFILVYIIWDYDSESIWDYLSLLSFEKSSLFTIEIALSFFATFPLGNVLLNACWTFSFYFPKYHNFFDILKSVYPF